MPAQKRAASRAVRPGADDGLIAGKAADADIQETAHGQPHDEQRALDSEVQSVLWTSYPTVEADAAGRR